MDAKKYSFGKIAYLGTGSKDECIRRILGVSSSSPGFINNTDSNLWRDNWDRRAKNLNINYIHGQSRFDKNTSNWGGLSQREIEAGTECIADLLESYDTAARIYNEEISEPFINERKDIVDTILLSK